MAACTPFKSFKIINKLKLIEIAFDFSILVKVLLPSLPTCPFITIILKSAT